ncbi:hypothetical protein [Aeromicrobium sp.]|uniref:hypothetical protein n=1 Tax=Aeromicrobium sp. TaxID=1871063 RepID=UPI0019871490|nr:hypothetical protein [Aeromicrobium sp.]MBC7631660.1 HAD family hydrolase [Aeromicrobium sp.]
MIAAGTVVVSDLDQTLIYSSATLRLLEADQDAPRLVCVEVYQGAPLSFVTETAAGHLTDLAEAGVFVPATTRTIEQFRRVHLPGPAPKFALCANGGRLLRDGIEDLDFTAAVTERLSGAGAPFAEMLDELHRASAGERGASFVEKVRDASGLFCYVVVNRAAMPASWVNDLMAFAEERGWGVSVQGRKVYCVPAALTKATAAREVSDMLGATRLLAAGDSLLDAELLEVADVAVRPRHGELADASWSRPHLRVTTSAGVRAGEEITAWMVAEALGH